MIGIGAAGAKARAAVAAASRPVPAIEPLENVRQVLPGNAFARIFHHHDRLLAASCQRDPDRAAGGRVLQTVVEQDDEQLLQLVAVSRQLDAGGELRLEPHPVQFRQRFEQPHHMADQLVKPHVAEQQLFPAGIGPGEQQQLVRQLGHPLRFREHHRDLLAVFQRGAIRVHQHQLRVRLDDRQRHAQLVGSVGGEPALLLPGAANRPERLIGEVQAGQNGQRAAQSEPDQEPVGEPVQHRLLGIHIDDGLNVHDRDRRCR